MPSQRPAVGALWRRFGGRNMCSWPAAPAQGSGELARGRGLLVPVPWDGASPCVCWGLAAQELLPSPFTEGQQLFLPCVAIPRGRELRGDLVSIAGTTPGAGGTRGPPPRVGVMSVALEALPDLSLGDV